MADLIYKNRINTPRIKEIFAAGVFAENQQEKDKYREMLYRELKDFYDNLLEYNFRQLHFHEPDNISFLRFHRPDKYGDDLTGIRYSVEYVNREHKYISGFEEGRIFNGYRFVYPLELDGRHIGSVEISISIFTIITHLEEHFNKKAQFILSKKVIDEKVFPEEQTNYTTWSVDNEFLLDNAVNPECILLDHIKDSDNSRISVKLKESEQTGKPFVFETKFDSEWKMITFLPITDFSGEVVAFLLSVSPENDLLELRRSFIVVSAMFLIMLILLIVFFMYYIISQKKIEYLADNDYLTGLSTRRIISSLIDDELARFQRYHTEFSLIMIDIDHFKSVNDTWGHQTGDTVLKKVAEILMNNIRNTDAAGRYGGEEFLLILPETDLERAAEVAEHLRNLVESYQFEGVGKITVSCGVSSCRTDNDTFESLVSVADGNMYEAKNSGRNRVVAK